MIKGYHEEKPHRISRILWVGVNATIFRLLPRHICWPLRRAILMAFGAKVDRKAYIYPSCKIFLPKLLTVGRACIGPHTELYNKAPLIIGNETVISQGAFLCTASHDISSLTLPLTKAPIVIGNNVWVASRAYIGPGVTLGDGAVVGATASVYRSVEPWTVVGGNPARPIKKRIINA